MTYKSITYQEKYVKELLEKIVKGGGGEYMFSAPTGSGKTIMMSKFLAKFADKFSNYAFIWASPRRNLPLQSMDKIQGNTLLDCVLTETIAANRKIENNQIWFVNWEKMHGNLTKDTEQGNSLRDIVNNTRDDNLNIMLLVDEAHWGAQKSGTKVTHAIYDDIGADIVVYITATPKYSLDEKNTVKISLKSVRESEMVVSEIPLNYDLENDDVTMQADEKLLDMACNRRRILKEQHDGAGTGINPLLMVQIPNSEEGEAKREIVKRVLARYDMTEGKKNFVSLEEGRRDDEYVKNISDNDNDIDAVIFKQNVSLGWDCPRAKILVGLRSTNEPSFRLQTLGRIMRMPEQKYYENNEMNIGYFYSQDRDFDDSEGTFQSIMRRTVEVNRRSVIMSPTLPAVRIRMVDPQEKMDTEGFKRVFGEEAKERNTVERMRRAKEIEVTTLPTNPNIISPNRKNNDEYAVLQNEMDIQNQFESKLSGILRDDKINCKNLFDMEFIRILLKEAIYQMFVDAGNEKSEDKIHHQLIDDYNVETIKYPIVATMNKHEDVMKEFVESGIICFDWNVPETKLLSKCNDEEVKHDGVHPNCVMNYDEEYNKYAMQPAYVEIASKLEMNFCEKLDQAKNVRWWYKNGIGQGDFAIIYYDGCRPRRFMPDFIVRMNDDRIGIFETKIGFTLENAGKKPRALYEYICRHPELKLFGGIVSRRNNDNNNWIINDGSDFFSNPSHVGWKKLSL